MVNVTDSAKTNLSQYLKEKEVDTKSAAIRVYVAGFGWGGPSLGLALDEPKEDDKIFEYDDFKVVVNENELDNIGNIEVDFRESRYGSGFTVRSAHSSTC